VEVNSKLVAYTVDDQMVMRELMRRMLTDMGLISHEFSSGAVALTAMNTALPHVIFVDFHMKAMDGLTFIRMVRKRPDCPAIPIVMITGDIHPQLVTEAMSSGATDFIAKPISPTVLRVRTHAVLAQRQI
jgi:two-component system, chemotaxis family, chemotaxis protein CheY